nr:hypothetical protein Iba_chr09cCG14390 [Ipomoea batatas]
MTLKLHKPSDGSETRLGTRRWFGNGLKANPSHRVGRLLMLRWCTDYMLWLIRALYLPHNGSSGKLEWRQSEGKESRGGARSSRVKTFGGRAEIAEEFHWEAEVKSPRRADMAGTEFGVAIRGEKQLLSHKLMKPRLRELQQRRIMLVWRIGIQ